MTFFKCHFQLLSGTTGKNYSWGNVTIQLKFRNNTCYLMSARIHTCSLCCQDNVLQRTVQSFIIDIWEPDNNDDGDDYDDDNDDDDKNDHDDDNDDDDYEEHLMEKV